MNNSSGQSLIETVVALFVLVTGLASGLALAVFAFGGASDITEKITASGLAQEGTEGVRRMRDSNWLQGSLVSGGVCGTGQVCYATWLTQRYNIQGSVAGTAYRLRFNPAALESNGTWPDRWELQASPDPPGENFFRIYQSPTGGLHHSNIIGSAQINFFRKIFIIQSSTAVPYSATSPLLLVRSVVWWTGKRCANILNYNQPSNTNCKIISEEYLTNWKNY